VETGRASQVEGVHVISRAGVTCGNGSRVTGGRCACDKQRGDDLWKRIESHRWKVCM
jgi:hypothetical protein